MSTFPTDAEQQAMQEDCHLADGGGWCYTHAALADGICLTVQSNLATLAPLVADRERAAAARVEAEHRQDWADYIESWQSAVGSPAPTPAAIVEALRKPRPPFGRNAVLGGDR